MEKFDAKIASNCDCGFTFLGSLGKIDRGILFYPKSQGKSYGTRALSITIVSLKGLFMTLRIDDTKHKQPSA